MKDENIFLGKHFFLQLLLIQTAFRISNLNNSNLGMLIFGSFFHNTNQW